MSNKKYSSNLARLSKITLLFSTHITFRYPCFSSHFCILAIKQIWWRNKYLKCRSYVIVIFIWSRISIKKIANMLCKNKENPNIRWYISFDNNSQVVWGPNYNIVNSFMIFHNIYHDFLSVWSIYLLCYFYFFWINFWKANDLLPKKTPSCVFRLRYNEGEQATHANT